MHPELLTALHHALLAKMLKSLLQLLLGSLLASILADKLPQFYGLSRAKLHRRKLPTRRPVGCPLPGRIVAGNGRTTTYRRGCAAVEHGAAHVTHRSRFTRIGRPADETERETDQQTSLETDPDAVLTAVSAAVRAASARTQWETTRRADRRIASPALRHTSPRTPVHFPPRTKDQGLPETTSETACGTMYDTTIQTMRGVLPKVRVSFRQLRA